MAESSIPTQVESTSLADVSGLLKRPFDEGSDGSATLALATHPQKKV